MAPAADDQMHRPPTITHDAQGAPAPLLVVAVTHVLGGQAVHVQPVVPQAVALADWENPAGQSGGN